MVPLSDAPGLHLYQGSLAKNARSVTGNHLSVESYIFGIWYGNQETTGDPSNITRRKTHEFRVHLSLIGVNSGQPFMAQRSAAEGERLVLPLVIQRACFHPVSHCIPPCPSVELRNLI